MSPRPRIAFSAMAFPDAGLATAVSLGCAWGYGGVKIEEPEVALPQHLRLLESWLRDPQEAV